MELSIRWFAAALLAALLLPPVWAAEARATKWMLIDDAPSTDWAAPSTVELLDDGGLWTTRVGCYYETEDAAAPICEQLSAFGRYERQADQISFSIEHVHDGWFWSFARVTCTLAATGEQLRLTACEGFDPAPYTTDPEQPGDMIFRRLKP